MEYRGRITVLSVGGTITMTGSGGGGVVPRLGAEALLAALPLASDICDIEAVTISKMPSPHMDLVSMVDIAAAIRRAREKGADGVVVVQGTDTLEETAFALELILGASGPVAVTGAMRNPSLPGSDGPANLDAAIRAVASDKLDGVVVVMDGLIHAPRYVRKTHTSRGSAFESHPVTLGEITDKGIVRFAHLDPFPFAFPAVLAPAPVALHVASMGDHGQLLSFVEAAGYRGLVIAGLGGGHVHPLMVPQLEQLATRMPVLVGSRTGSGTTLGTTYGYAGGEIDLLGRGITLTGWLAPVKARVALSLLLGAGGTSDEITAFFAASGGASGRS